MRQLVFLALVASLLGACAVTRPTVKSPDPVSFWQNRVQTLEIKWSNNGGPEPILHAYDRAGNILVDNHEVKADGVLWTFEQNDWVVRTMFMFKPPTNIHLEYSQQLDNELRGKKDWYSTLWIKAGAAGCWPFELSGKGGNLVGSLMALEKPPERCPITMESGKK